MDDGGGVLELEDSNSDVDSNGITPGLGCGGEELEPLLQLLLLSVSVSNSDFSMHNSLSVELHSGVVALGVDVVGGGLANKRNPEEVLFSLLLTPFEETESGVFVDKVVVRVGVVATERDEVVDVEVGEE